MSGISYQPLVPGDPRDAAGVNAIWNAIAAASASVTAQNLAEEGLDARALEAHPVGARTGEIKETTRNAASLAVAAAMTQFAHNGVVYRLTSGGGQIPGALAAGEALRIRSRVWYETTLAAGQGFTGNLENALAWDAGGGALLDFSRRDEGTASGPRRHTVMFCEGWLIGPVAALQWVELQYTLSAGGIAFPSLGMIWGTLFRRQALV